jgi:predicted Zn-dependent protease with MMP-like domain
MNHKLNDVFQTKKCSIFVNEIHSYFGINDKNLENLEYSEIFPKNLIIKY